MKTKLKQLISFFIIFTFFLLQLQISFFSIQKVSAASNREVTFAELGSPQIIMHGPYGLGSVRFSLPAHWELVDGAQLQLLISSFSTGNENFGNPQNNNIFLGAMLDVFFNGELQQSIPLKSGTDVSYNVPIRFADLDSPRSDGILEISFFLNASIDCNYDFHQTTIMISPNSSLIVPYQERLIPLDLRNLPWPMYQEELALEERSGIVLIPAVPSEDEMQAALITMATFARLTDEKYPLKLLSVSQITNDLLSTSDLIIVGKPASLPILQELTLPIPVNEKRFLDSKIQNDDGVLQITHSPWGKEKIILIVSGNLDVGVVKAAQTLSIGNLQTALRPDRSIIEEVKPISIATSNPINMPLFDSPNFTMSDIGYSTETVSSVGVNWISFEVFIPLGYEPIEKPFIDIYFSNSSLVNPDRSGFVLYMNAELIGSGTFSEETTKVTSEHIEIPISVLKPGRNKIDIAATLLPFDACSTASFTGLWMSVFPETLIHLPIQPISGEKVIPQKLNVYPYPFINDPSFASTSFVMSDKDTSVWSSVGDIAYFLGRQTKGVAIAFDVIYDEPNTLYGENQHLIIVGIPQKLPIIYRLKENLPAYFEENTNIAILEDQQVVYRFIEGKDLGYLQFFASPWGENSSIVAILGTSSTGVVNATNALVDPLIRSRLQGDFVTLDGEHETVIDSSTGLGTGLLVPNLGPSVTVVQETPDPTFQETLEVDVTATRKKILPILVGVVVLIIIIAAIAFISRPKTSNTNYYKDRSS